MTPLSPARRAAEDFARAIDGHSRVAADRHADLLPLVAALRTQEPPAPRPDFVASLRERLMDAADTLLIPADTQAPVVSITDLQRRRQRRLSIAAASLVIVGGSAGVAVASDNALPGDPLYPLKRSIESARVAFSTSDLGRGQDLLRQASTRLTEVGSLLSEPDSTKQITQTLSSYTESATEGADLIFVSYQNTGKSETIGDLRSVLTSQREQLDSLAENAPAGSTRAFARAQAAIDDLDQQAAVLCSTCTEASVTTSSKALVELLAGQSNPTDAERSKLAGIAGEIAKNSSPTPTAGVPQPIPTLPDGEGSLGPVDPSVAPDPTTLPETVRGLTKNLTEILGELTAPLTETLSGTVNGTLNGLTGRTPTPSPTDGETAPLPKN